MRLPQNAAALGACLVAGLLAFAPLSFLIWHRKTFGVHTGSLVLSALLWIGAFAMTVLTAQLVSRAVSRNSRIPLLVVAGLTALQTATFALIYVGSYYSNLLWGDNLTTYVAETAVANPDVLLNFLGISIDPKFAHLVLPVGAGVIVLALALVWLVVIRVFVTRSERGFADISPLRPMSLFAVCGIASALLLFFAPRATQGEPVLDFFGAAPSRNLLDWDNDRIEAALASRRDELGYPQQRTDLPRKNVVIILSDSIRADHLDIYGYPRPTTPFLSDLVASKRAVAIDTMLSTCSESYCGIASMLASQPFNKLSPQNFKLNSVLKRAGYRISYYLSGDHRGWRYLWDFYGNDIDDMRDCVARACKDHHDDAELIADLKNVEPFDGRPRFFFFFLMSTHRVGTKFPEYQRFKPVWNDIELIAKRKLEGPQSFDAHGVPLYRPLTQDELLALSNTYDNGLVQADAMKKQIFSVLEEKGYLRDSIVLFSSDHGESLGENGHVSHGMFLYQKDIRIPLIIYDQDISAYQDTAYGTQVDIAPTILSRLGLPIPSAWAGVPLTKPGSLRSTLHQIRNRERPCAASIRRTEDSFEKYIRCRGPDRRISEEFFDLRRDPSEKANIVDAASPSDLAMFRAETARLVDDAVCSGKEYYCGRR